MRPFSVLAVLAVLACLGLVACDDEETPTSDVQDTGAPADAGALTDAAGADANSPTGDPVSIEDWPATLAAVLCARFESCCTADQLGEGWDEATCTAGLTPGFDQGLGHTRAAITMGYAAWDADGAGACIALHAAAACDQASQCALFHKPLVAHEGACKTELDCIDGWCDSAAMSPTCKPFAASGEACMENLECADGTYCEMATGTCAPQLADGAPCSSESDCASGGCSDAGTCGAPPPVDTCAGIPSFQP